MKKYILLLISLYLSSCDNFNYNQQKGPNSQQRSIAFKKIAANIKSIDDVLNNNITYNPQEFKELANELFENSKKPFLYFSNDGQGKNGKAKQEIWNNFEKFNSEKNNFLKSINDFNKLAQSSSNLNQLKISFSKVENSCKSCHSKFKQ